MSAAPRDTTVTDASIAEAMELAGRFHLQYSDVRALACLIAYVRALQAARYAPLVGGAS